MSAGNSLTLSHNEVVLSRPRISSEITTTEVDEDLDSAAEQLNRRPYLPVSAEDVARAVNRPSFLPQPSLEFSSEAPSQARLTGAIASLVDLHEIAIQMSREKNEMDAIEIAVHGARSRLGIDRLAIFLANGEYVRGTFSTDEFGKVVSERTFRRKITDLAEHEMVERAFREQNYLLVRENVTLRVGDRAMGTGWNVMVALWYGEQPLGWIACDNLLTGAPLEPFQIEVMKLFASTLAHALVRVRAEQELRQLNQELEVRVATLTVELDEANAELERVNAELSRVKARLSPK